MTIITQIPGEVLEIILKKLDKLSLLYLKNSCNFFRDFIPDCCESSKDYWGISHTWFRHNMQHVEIWNRLARLYFTEKKCDCCGKKTFVETYYEFQVRACKICIMKVLVPEYQLNMIKLPEELYILLPSIHGEFRVYNTRGSRQRLYLKRDIELILGEYFSIKKNRLETMLGEILEKKLDEKMFIPRENERLLKIKLQKEEEKLERKRVIMERKERWKAFTPDEKKNKMETENEKVIKYCCESRRRPNLNEEILSSLKSFKKFLNRRGTTEYSLEQWQDKFITERWVQIADQ